MWSHDPIWKACGNSKLQKLVCKSFDFCFLNAQKLMKYAKFFAIVLYYTKIITDRVTVIKRWVRSALKAWLIK